MKRESTCTLSEIGFRVEVRNEYFSHLNPVEIADGIIGPDWREVQFGRSRNPAGIPDEPFGQKGAHDLLTYEGAVALAWTLIAQHKRHGIECRLVKYKLETSHTLDREGVLNEAVIRRDLKRSFEVVSSDPPQP